MEYKNTEYCYQLPMRIHNPAHTSGLVMQHDLANIALGNGYGTDFFIGAVMYVTELQCCIVPKPKWVIFYLK
jgi:hypothetical protein